MNGQGGASVPEDWGGAGGKEEPDWAERVYGWGTAKGPEVNSIQLPSLSWRPECSLWVLATKQRRSQGTERRLEAGWDHQRWRRLGAGQHQQWWETFGVNPLQFHNQLNQKQAQLTPSNRSPLVLNERHWNRQYCR